MKKNILTIAFCSMLFGLFFPIAERSAAQAKQNAPEAKFALLVGINKYDDTGISTLGGTLNDVKLMRDLLIDPEVGYNFRADDIMELLSPGDAKELVSPEMSRAGKPTRENIKNAFQKHLIDKAAEFKRKNPTRTPQIEGNVDRTFLGSKASRNKRGIKILKSDKEGKDTILTIEAGRVIGALPDVTVGVYGENAVQLVGDENRIAAGKIESSDNFTAKVRVIETDVPAKARLVLVNPFFTKEKRKVAIDTSGDAATAKRIGAALKDNAYVEATETVKATDAAAKNWDVAIVRGTFGDFTKGNRQYVEDASKKLPADAQPGYYLLTPNGTRPLYNLWIPAEQTDAGERIKTALELHTRVTNLLALDNAANTETSKGLKIELIKLKSYDQTSGKCEEFTADEREKMSRNALQLNPDDFFYFSITNNSGKNLYPYLYDISTDGQIGLMYQPPAPGDLLKPGTTLKTFDAGTCSGDYLFQAAAPLGKETFKLIAASSMFDGKILESPKIAQEIIADSKDAGLRGAGDAALEDLFIEASTNKPATRNIKKTSVPFNGWATTVVTAEITEKKNP